MVAVHEAGASLDIESGIFLLDRLKLSRGVDGDIPASRLLTDLFLIFFQAVDAEGNRHVEFRALLKNARDVRNNPLLNLAVRHQVDRFELVVLVKRSGDLGKILSREGFAAGDDQNAEIGA